METVEVTESVDSLIKFNITEAAIQEMANKYLPLKVADVNDKQGYEKCHAARMVVKAKRVEVEKRRKELKADALTFGRKVDARAAEITAQLSVIEDHLEAQQKIVDDEKERLRKEQELRVKQILDGRVARLQACKATGYSIDSLKQMSQAEFEDFAVKAEAEFEAAEAIRLENERKIKLFEQQEAERKRIQAEKDAEEQAKKDAELAAQRKATDEANKRAAEAAARERLAREEADRIKADAERKEREEKAAAAKREADALAKIADEKALEQIKSEFPTIEAAWVEIFNLRKKLI